MQTRPVWAEVSLERLRHNFDLLRRQAAGHVPARPPDLLAVVKADAYGHGVQSCGPALAAAGAHWLGVTSVEEGAALRRVLGVLPSHLSAARILVMSSLWHGEADMLLDRALTPQAWEPYQLGLLVDAAARLGLPARSLAVHLEIDTGMARQGVAPGPLLAALLATYFRPDSPLLLEGVMTHFSAPEALDEPDTDAQIARFVVALDQIQAFGESPAWLHAGNSTTVFDQRHTVALAELARRYGAQLMLRPGLALYGYPVRFKAKAGLVPSMLDAQAQLEPVLTWKTRITSLREIGAGEGAGYNSTFRAGRPTRLALTPIGYADGLNRMLSNKGSMLVRGRRAPIAGRISMDQTMLDVTEIADAAIGDEVIILGQQASALGQQACDAITAWEHADLCETIPYEILCDIASRVPRVVVD